MPSCHEWNLTKPVKIDGLDTLRHAGLRTRTATGSVCLTAPEGL